MKKPVYRIQIVILVAVSLLSACQNGTSPAEPGVLDVSIQSIESGVVSLGTATFGVYVYPQNTGDIYDPANCLALNQTTIGNSAENVRLKVTDGNFNPTAEDWIGEPGWGRYDMYILIDLNGSGDLETGIGERTNGYPSTFTIDGETLIVLDYVSDLIER